ncbi:MAG: hypothetical protein EP323_01790 [Gammaproteobacteria bacterium]|nr:MAG: hypothetical protein EP323_01790 [Gammaproteobacteria bacterium]
MDVRRPIIRFLVLVIALHTGCAMAPHTLSTVHQGALGNVAVVSTTQMPEISFKGFVHNKAEGALVGAGGTFVGCVGLMGQGSCTGGICAAGMVLWLGVCAVSSVVGGTAGAVVSPAGEETRSAEQAMVSALDAKTIQDSLRIQVEQAAEYVDYFLMPLSPQVMDRVQQQRDYRQLAAEGVDAVLEVSLTKVGTRNGGFDPPLRLYMEAQAHLVSTADNRDLMSEDYLYTGPSMKLEGWSANNAEQLLKAIETGYEELGTHIFDMSFRLYPFPDRGPHKAGFMGVSFGLAPLEPPTRGAMTGDEFIGAHFEWTEVKSYSPTLRWQAFPREEDLEIAPDDMARVSNIRYDLIVAEESNMAPGKVVYRRYGLLLASHTVGVTLKRKTRYFWTVRARFELDGRERVTEWSSTHYESRLGRTAPSIYSYRFRTH